MIDGKEVPTVATTAGLVRAGAISRSGKSMMTGGGYRSGNTEWEICKQDYLSANGAIHSLKTGAIRSGKGACRSLDVVG